MQISTSLVVASVLAIARLGHGYCFLLNTATYQCLNSHNAQPSWYYLGSDECPAGTTNHGIVSYATGQNCGPSNDKDFGYNYSRCCQL
ncbi:hypothetical protein BST61_g6457 [Cercospora zeina]